MNELASQFAKARVADDLLARGKQLADPDAGSAAGFSDGFASSRCQTREVPAVPDQRVKTDQTRQ